MSINYRKQIGFLKGLCKGLNYTSDTPEGKLLVSIIDTLDSFSDEIDKVKDDIEALTDDLQDISDEIGELESISEDIESLEEQIESLGDSLGDFSEMYESNPEYLFRPVVSRPIRLVKGGENALGDSPDDDDDDDDDDDGGEGVRVSIVCPKCGERIPVTDENISVE